MIEYAGHTAGGDEPAALLLAGPDGDDGTVTADDISRLRLSTTNLVVLAACSSARGSVQHVEGVQSLTRAFLAAGAGAVVGTLWEIDDALTAPVFTGLHRRIAAGDSPLHALQAAQLDALRSPDPNERHPATWGGLVLSGNAI